MHNTARGSHRPPALGTMVSFIGLVRRGFPTYEMLPRIDVAAHPRR
jgi:hypothetical protein